MSCPLFSLLIFPRLLVRSAWGMKLYCWQVRWWRGFVITVFVVGFNVGMGQAGDAVDFAGNKIVGILLGARSGAGVGVGVGTNIDACGAASLSWLVAWFCQLLLHGGNIHGGQEHSTARSNETLCDC
jgi:hypothetical protein